MSETAALLNSTTQATIPQAMTAPQPVEKPAVTITSWLSVDREPTNDDEWGNIYNKLGRPEKAEDYGIKDDSYPEYTQSMLSAMHKAGLSKRQAEILNNANNEFVNNLKTLSHEQLQKSEQEFEQKTGAALQQIKELVKKGIGKLSLKEKDLNNLYSSIGVEKTMGLLSELGKAVSEGSGYMASSAQPINQQQKQYTQDTAIRFLEDLKYGKNNEFKKKLLTGDKEATTEHFRISRIATGFNS